MDFGNRRPGYPVKAPAIARHAVFRLRKDENPQWHSMKENERYWETLLKCLSAHINALREVYGNPPTVQLVRPDEPPDEKSGVYCVRGSCIVPVAEAPVHGYRLRVRVDVHTEMFSLTYIFDDIRPSDAEGNALAAKIAGLPGDTAALAWLFDDIWSSAEDSGIPGTRVAHPWLDGPKGEPPQRCSGTLITDFRSIILPAKVLVDAGIAGDDDAPLERAGQPSLHRDLRTIMTRHKGLVLAAADEVPTATPAEEEGRLSGEPVICGMLDGEALYAARLGQWNQGRTGIQPIRHLLVYAGSSSEQLGRLVRRMYVLGQLRHAALIDFEPEMAQDDAPDSAIPGGGLREASRQMRRLGRELSADTAELWNPEAEMKVLHEAVPRLAAINELIEGGLTYRVERARYYTREFKDMIAHLRLVRLRDWVSYDDFAKRHIIHLLDRVDHIGERYEALTRRVHRLLFFKQAQRLEGYTETVRNALVTIDKATSALNISSGRQTKLLIYGEAFATVFLFYYVGSVIDHLYQVPGSMGLLSHHGFYILWAILIALPATGLVLGRLYEWRGHLLARRGKRKALRPARAKDRGSLLGEAGEAPSLGVRGANLDG